MLPLLLFFAFKILLPLKTLLFNHFENGQIDQLQLVGGKEYFFFDFFIGKILCSLI